MSLAHDHPLTFRVYRDPEACPVPLVTTSEPAWTSFEDSGARPDAYGDTAVVEPFERAQGLVTGRLAFRSDRLETSWLASEPVLLTLQAGADMDNGGLYRKLARPLAYEGGGPNPYTAPALVQYDVFRGSELRLFVPFAAAGPGPDVWTSVTAPSLGNGVFMLPRGLPVIGTPQVGGLPFEGVFDYDPHHGALYLQDQDSRTTVAPDVQVIVPVSLVSTLSYAVPNARIASKPLPVSVRDGLVHFHTPGRKASVAPTTPAAAKQNQASVPYVFGYLVPRAADGVFDLRRLPPPVLDGDRYHRLDTGFYDAGPVQTSCLWEIVTDADPDRLLDAVRRSMPAGTLYRTTLPDDQ